MSAPKKPNRVNVNVSLNPSQQRVFAKIIKWLEASGRKDIPASAAMRELALKAEDAMRKGVHASDYLRRDI